MKKAWLALASLVLFVGGFVLANVMSNRLVYFSRCGDEEFRIFIGGIMLYFLGFGVATGVFFANKALKLLMEPSKANNEIDEPQRCA